MAEETKKVEKQDKRFLCKVYRLNTETENAKLPISVNVIGKKKREFYPGQEVVLHDYHIEVLRNAVDSTQLEIPAESGIYESKNPVSEAERAFPGFIARQNLMDGSITLIRDIPLYSIEIIKEM